MSKPKYTSKDVRAAFSVLQVVAQTIQELGRVPSGHLYARLAGYMNLQTYNKIIKLLLDTKLIRQENHELIWVGEKNNPRFDAPKKAQKSKWYAILPFNGTQPLVRVVISFERKSKANNYAKDLIGKLYKARLVTSVVLEGPFSSMTEANTFPIELPAPT